ncbi:MAG: ATP-binding protein [Patescibacteria group bacterium]|nr:ATP-binding protein [Patescibacteria group bacterium]
MDSDVAIDDFLTDPRYDETLVRAILDTIREPLLVLDEKLRVLAASHVFYKDFQVNPEETIGRELRALGNGQWDIPALRKLLLEIIPEKRAVTDYEVEHTFESLGRRVMLVTAQEVRIERNSGKEKHLLISFNDVTDSRQHEQESRRLLDEQKLLLEEVRHRMANNLQLIVGILLLKAESSASDEVRLHLTDTHNRLMSIAMLEKHLQPLGIEEYVDIHEYLATLCGSLTASFINDSMHILLNLDAAHKRVPSSEAVLLGLVTTELVINALKYAFLGKKDGQISVRFEIYKDAWQLSVSDNGAGISLTQQTQGIGTGLIDAFARQLKAEVERESDAKGTTVHIVYRGAEGILK